HDDRIVPLADRARIDDRRFEPRGDALLDDLLNGGRRHDDQGMARRLGEVGEAPLAADGPPRLITGIDRGEAAGKAALRKILEDLARPAGARAGADDGDRRRPEDGGRRTKFLLPRLLARLLPVHVLPLSAGSCALSAGKVSQESSVCLAKFFSGRSKA